jgi:glycosyltransferase involved in cell wall biosynthesis
MNLGGRDFVIVAENLRIGGVQRLLIDESYQFLAWDSNPHIVSLAPKMPGDHLPDLDEEFKPSKKLNITHLSANKAAQINYFYKLMCKKESPRVFITHSTTGAALLRISAILALKKILIILQIHQLITLSDKRQQFKRILYSMCANHVLFSSNQFLLEWMLLINRKKYSKLIYRKRLKFDRMGVYLPRLSSSDFEKKQLCKTDVPHLIFLSRVTSWKGFEKFKSLTVQYSSSEIHTLAMTASNYRKDILNPDEFNTDQSHVVFNSSVTSLQLNLGSVHLYPSDYGPNIKHPQSIGMNVLEMISQGIPSLISKEGFESWPELQDTELVKVVDWNNTEDVLSTIESSRKLSSQRRREEFEKLSEAISIEDHCRRLVKLMQSFPQ